jgi:hypothetical protein
VVVTLTPNSTVTVVSTGGLNSPDSAAGIILDDDARYLSVQFGAASKSESSGTVSVMISRNMGSVGAPMTVHLGYSGTATKANDYMPILSGGPSATLTFAKGQRTIYGTIAIENDSFIEPNEFATITATPIDPNTVKQSLSSGANSATLTIVDDDRTINNNWTVVDVPPSTTYYRPWTKDDGSTPQWTFDPGTRNWIRVKVVESWQPLSGTIKAWPTGQEIPPAEKFNYYVENAYSWTISGGPGESLPITVGPTYGVTQGTGDSWSYDPRDASSPMPGVTWGSVPLGLTVQYVRQYIYDANGANHSTPLGQDADDGNAEALITSESAVFIGILPPRLQSWESQGNAAVYIHN